MIKILFFIDTLTGGGAEKVLRTLVNNMDQEQFQITVQTVEEADAEKYLVPGIRYKAINRFKSPLLKKLFSYWIRLCAEMGWIYPLYIKDEYDIEVAYLEFGPTKFLSGSTNQKALKLAWIHCDFLRRNVQPTKKLQRIYSTYDKVICVSRTVQSSFRKLFGNAPDTLILHNVNDEDDIIRKSDAFSVQNDAFTFLFVGRLSHEKGADRLLDACRMLKDCGKVFRMQILGEGPERSALESQIHQLQLQDCVELLGFRDNPYPYMKAADCIVCSSRYEGFSTVVTEALILGKPVVTTPCSGMDELLGDSEFGLITEDSTEGIFRGMEAMLADPEKCRQYAILAGLRGQAFSKESTVTLTQQFFKTELSKKRQH